ncbi:N-succinyl-L,L-diaminopimelate aminotransferase, type 2 [hydrothermal vent metagenome]|uniref:N-succinyl-L,L-diaminopimelate aminotransferase, type 2 n=1 Tax=hydrothermal vent metagenome TaxID=652676 RepID=A0A3B1B9H0_9ZZZZ
MNPDLAKLQPYPFEKLAALKGGITPPAGLDHIALSIGEPKHPTPNFIAEELLTHLHSLSSYPITKGTQALRQAIADWLIHRFKLLNGIDPETQVLPVNGTREALFAFAQTIIDRSQNPLVLMPNPFYQIYEGAALLAGAEPHFLPCTAESGFTPDFAAVNDATWDRCQLLYLCSPHNPTGSVIGIEQLQQLINLAAKHNFIIAADECYSEIYPDESNPPPSLLQAATEMGNTEYQHCMVFNSLSKRSNAPGMRSGFVAGNAAIIASFCRYRTYHGCAMPLPVQAASIKAWGNETHVQHSRELYREKFTAVLNALGDLLPIQQPDAGFYLWPETPIPDPEFAQGLFAQQNISVLPGSYLSRNLNGHNPGQNRIRMALVAPLDECIAAARRIKTFIESTENRRQI